MGRTVIGPVPSSSNEIIRAKHSLGFVDKYHNTIPSKLSNVHKMWSHETLIRL